jgi:DNA-binding HxlR family transcriptional regulator
VREPFGVTIATCQLRDVLDRVGDKWSVLVMALIGTGPKRGSQLQHAIDGISHRMLTLTLRSLERDGLVSRMVTLCACADLQSRGDTASARPASTASAAA